MRKELLHTLENMTDITVMREFIKRQLHEEMHQLEDYIDFLSEEAQGRWNLAFNETFNSNK